MTTDGRGRPGPVASTTGAAPDSGERFAPEQDTLRRMASVADARSGLWSLCHDLISAPDVALAGRLRAGEVTEQLELTTAWLGEEAGRFLAVQMALETYARRARRRTTEEDLSELTEAWSRPELADLSWRPTLQQLADLCEREAKAWWAGDHEVAKELRVGQREVIEQDLTEQVPAWATTLDTSATPMVYRSVARLVVLHLTFESGRDIERAVYGTDLLTWDQA